MTAAAAQVRAGDAVAKWSPQQADALDKCANWLRSADAPVFRLFGYAGTGKTTLARHLAAGVSGQVAFAAFTGKAALVMRRSGCVNASTIHSLIYDARTKNNGSVSFRLKPRKEFEDIGLIVIDECSMVDEEIGEHLLSFGVPILVLGDPAQLPPVKGGGFFTDHLPDVMLTEIHRQARDNPIVRIATDVREGRPLRFGEYDETRIIPPDDIDARAVTDADQVLVGRNRTRTLYNARIRTLIGKNAPMPVVGDRLVCLRNDSTLGLLNGGIWTVDAVRNSRKVNPCISLVVASEDMPDLAAVPVSVRREFFEGRGGEIPWKEKRGTQEFDYGYALTVHKSQGSQWGDVVLFDESGAFREEGRRWLYTGITRAANRLTVVTRDADQ